MYIFTLKRAGWATAALLFLLIGCKKSATDTVTPASQGCLLQSDLITNSNGGKAGTVYTYNGNGQLVSSVFSSSTAAGAATGTPTTSTYTYDAAGNLLSTTSRSGSSSSTVTYEYNGGRLSKTTTQTSGSSPSTETYSYDGSGRLTTYIITSPQGTIGTYTYTNGTLTGATLINGTLSATITVGNGRITNLVIPDGTKYRYTYDANGYNTKAERLDAANTVQTYEVYEYGTSAYQSADPQPTNAPTINLYGKTDLPVTREAYYFGNNTLDEEFRYQYQINSKGYLTSVTRAYTAPGAPSETLTLAYVYSNCQ